MPLIGLWAFRNDDGKGTDSSGNANTALFQKGATQDANGNATFDGNDDYVEIPHGSQYAVAEGTIHGAFTVATGSMDGTRSSNINDNSFQTLVSRDSSGFDNGGHLTIYVDGDGSLLIRHQSSTEDYFIRTDAGTVTEGEEFNLVYSFSDTEGMTAYVNGVEVGSNTDAVANGDSIALSNNSEPWTLGASQSTSGNGKANDLQQYLEGSVGHFELYDEALAPGELNTIHDLSDGSDDGNISGTEGADTIYGGSSPDSEDGGAVINDTITAGGGDDVVYAGDGSDIVTGGLGDDTIYGGSGDDYLYGNAGNDSLIGGSGNDLLYGEGGDDTLVGGSGDDTFYTYFGADSVEGGTGSDIIYVFGAFGDDTIVGGEDPSLSSTPGAGSPELDVLSVQYLAVGVTADFTGDETGTISDGTNTAHFSEIEGIILTNYADSVTVSGTVSEDMNIAAGAGDDTITTADGDDLVTGGFGNDSLTGGGGSDTLEGGQGDDVLSGGAGDDTLTGGTGDDTFVMSQTGGADTITDFDLADDDGDGRSNDQLDVAALRDTEGNPVTISDVTVSEDGDGNAVLSFPEGESITLQGISAAQMTPQQMFASGIPCFTSGTLIETAGGERRVEELRVGDLVRTRDHGLQPILWCSRRAVGPATLNRSPELRPIRLDGGWTGDARGLLVSPQHGVLVRARAGGGERLVRAVQLARLAGGKARVARGRSRVLYVHLLFRQHEIIYANGIPTESLYPGPRTLASLGSVDLLRLLARIPGLAGGDVRAAYGAPCVPYLRGRELPASLGELRPAPRTLPAHLHALPPA